MPTAVLSAAVHSAASLGGDIQCSSCWSRYDAGSAALAGAGRLHIIQQSLQQVRGRQSSSCWRWRVTYSAAVAEAGTLRAVQHLQELAGCMHLLDLAGALSSSALSSHADSNAVSSSALSSVLSWRNAGSAALAGAGRLHTVQQSLEQVSCRLGLVQEHDSAHDIKHVPGFDP
ncbi:hypothetical protein COO60DRAFT_687258 [Scenedesmus sp. NREL 46B-D3]|nr:hypothetical protein COO60DRAFT_687258 [Scenedesmus sp. NREL 46B-D3]